MQDSEAEFSSRWRRRRVLFRWSVAGYFVLIAFGLGPLYFLRVVDMGPRKPADFSAEVQRYCVPVVRKMKEYERVHGKRPDDLRQFAPELVNTEEGWGCHLTGGTYMKFAKYHHEITYDFTPGNEHWSVTGPFVNGTIPLPPVILEPGNLSTTNP